MKPGRFFLKHINKPASQRKPYLQIWDVCESCGNKEFVAEFENQELGVEFARNHGTIIEEISEE
jgi:hypothetical protein